MVLVPFLSTPCEEIARVIFEGKDPRSANRRDMALAEAEGLGERSVEEIPGRRA